MECDIQLEKFELEQINNYNRINIFGPTRSGKTYLLKNILHQLEITSKHNYIVICTNYTKSDYKNINHVMYNNPLQFMRSNKKINYDTILIMEYCGYDSGILHRLNKIGTKIHKIIIINQCLSLFSILNTESEITFLFRGARNHTKKIYNKLIDSEYSIKNKKIYDKSVDIEYSIFENIINFRKNIGEIIVINRNDITRHQSIKSFCAESEETYWEENINYMDTKNIIRKIELGYSMFHKTTQNKSSSQANELLYIVCKENISMIYALLCFKEIDLIIDISLYILKLMIENKTMGRIPQSESSEECDAYSDPF